MTLLMLLTWFLLCLTFIACVVGLLSLFLQEKNPDLSKWSSWAVFALGCLSVLTVVITTGYLGMRFRLRVAGEEPCDEFGLMNNPQKRPKNVPDIALILNYFLTNFPEAEKWASWAAVGLCALAVLAFVVLLTLLLKDDDKKLLGKISPCRISKAEKAFGYKNFGDYNNKEIKIISGKYEKLSPVSGPLKPKSSYSLLNSASLGLLSAALIGVLLLHYYVGPEDEEIQPPCVSMDSHLKHSFNQEPQNHTALSARRLFFVPREDWLAVPPRSIKILRHPVQHVVVSYTSGGSCSSRSECMDTIRNLQISDMDRDGWWDIVHNFLVAGDDRVYEGRGWDVEALPNDRYGNGSLLVSFVGRFMHQLPPPYQMRSLKRVVEEGIRLGKISSLYKLAIDRKVEGSLLEKELQTWNHYWFR